METPYDLVAPAFGASSGGFRLTVATNTRQRPSPLERPASPAFVGILPFGFGDRLPLHVRRRVRTAGAERDDVVDHVARTGAFCLSGRRTRVFQTEIAFGSVAPRLRRFGRSMCQNSQYGENGKSRKQCVAYDHGKECLGGSAPFRTAGPVWRLRTISHQPERAHPSEGSPLREGPVFQSRFGIFLNVRFDFDQFPSITSFRKKR